MVKSETSLELQRVKNPITYRLALVDRAEMTRFAGLKGNLTQWYYFLRKAFQSFRTSYKASMLILLYSKFTTTKQHPNRLGFCSVLRYLCFVSFPLGIFVLNFTINVQHEPIPPPPFSGFSGGEVLV